MDTIFNKWFKLNKQNELQLKSNLTLFVTWEFKLVANGSLLCNNDLWCASRGYHTVFPLTHIERFIATIKNKQKIIYRHTIQNMIQIFFCWYSSIQNLTSDSDKETWIWSSWTLCLSVYKGCSDVTWFCGYNHALYKAWQS